MPFGPRLSREKYVTMTSHKCLLWLSRATRNYEHERDSRFCDLANKRYRSQPPRCLSRNINGLTNAPKHGTTLLSQALKFASNKLAPRIESITRLGKQRFGRTADLECRARPRTTTLLRLSRSAIREHIRRGKSRANLRHIAGFW